MFAILWATSQNPRIWPKSSHLGPPERYSQQRYEGIFPDSSPGASPAVDLAAFDQGALEPPNDRTVSYLTPYRLPQLCHKFSELRGAARKNADIPATYTKRGATAGIRTRTKAKRKP